MNTLPTALVTGGGSGIGKEICKRFYREGYNLIVVSLIEEELIDLEHELSLESNNTPMVHTLALDLTSPDAIETVLAFCESTHLTINTLINNAGFGLHGSHHELPAERLRAMLQLNVVAVSALCHGVAQRMLKEENNTPQQYAIINIGSTSGFQPLPKLAAYAASKAFIISFTEALAIELQSENIRVHCICPGTTKTPFLDVAGLSDTSRFGSTAHIAHKIAMPPADVATVVYDTLHKKQVVSTPGAVNTLHRHLTNWLPKTFIKPIAGMLFNR